jgi:hypothetical protein
MGKGEGPLAKRVKKTKESPASSASASAPSKKATDMEEELARPAAVEADQGVPLEEGATFESLVRETTNERRENEASFLPLPPLFFSATLFYKSL